MNDLIRITWTREGVTHSVLKTPPAAALLADYLHRTYQITAIVLDTC